MDFNLTAKDATNKLKVFLRPLRKYFAIPAVKLFNHKRIEITLLSRIS